MSSTDVPIPNVQDLYMPVLRALRGLDGLGSREEIYGEVVKIMNLTEEQLKIFPSSGNRKEPAIRFRIGFALTHLKRNGLLENPSLGVWALTEESGEITEIDSKEVKRVADRVRRQEKAREKSNMAQVSIPTLDKLMNPMLLVFHRLGGSGTNEEIYDEVVELLQLTDEQLEVLHEPGKGTQTEIAYRLTVARSYLKKYGLLDNIKPKLWALTEKGSAIARVNPYAVILNYQQMAWEESMQRQRSMLPDFRDVDETLSW